MTSKITQAWPHRWLASVGLLAKKLLPRSSFQSGAPKSSAEAVAPVHFQRTHSQSPPLILTIPAIATIILSSVIFLPSAAAEEEALEWRWQTDANGSVTRITDPGGLTVAIETLEQDNGAAPALRQIVDYPDDRQEFAFDARENLLRAVNGTGRIEVAYDSLDRPVEFLSDDAPDLEYTYDVFGRPVSRTIGETGAFTYSYDYLGRVSRIDTPAGPVTYQYHRASGNVIRRLPNGIETYRTFDKSGALAEITHAGPDRSIFAQFTYRYRPDGLIGETSEFTRVSGENTCGYRYDNMKRLTGIECSSGRKWSFAYDAFGNLVGRTGPGNAAFEFGSGVAGILRSHSWGETRSDARGHVRSLPGPRGPIAFQFNGAARISAVVDRVQYRYNALGLLVARDTGGKAEKYLPDPFVDAWRPLWKQDAGSESLFLWDGPTPLMEIRDGTAIYRLEDHLGSPRVVMDEAGQALSWPAYGPYGRPVDEAAGASLLPGFAGLFWDPDAQIYLTAQRAYHPQTARFLQPDPVLRQPDASRFNHTLYAYAGGDPVNFVDRNGADAEQFRPYPNSATTNRQSLTGTPWYFRFFKRQYNIGIENALANNTNQSLEKIRHVSRELYSKAYDSFSHLRGWERQKESVALTKMLVFRIRHLGPLGSNPSLSTIESAVAQMIEDGYAMPDSYQSIVDLASGIYRNGDNLSFNEQEIQTLGNMWDHLENSVTFTPMGADIKRFLYDGIFKPFMRPFDLGDVPFHVPQSKIRHTMVGVAGDIGRRAYSDPELIMNFLNTPWKLETIEELPKALHQYESRPVLPVLPYHWYKNWNIGPLASAPGEFPSLIPQERQSLVTTGSRGSRLGDLASSEFKSPLDYARSLLQSASSILGSFGASEVEAATIPFAPGHDGFAAPSQVGGVYLGGAAGHLEGLDRVTGVALDEATGRLVLLGASGGDIDLPPLPLSAIVPVFRAVYDHGQAPSVTIDPMPGDPNGPEMIVAHGPATGDTYPGWILYQCDRIMKAYMMSRDNITGEPVSTMAPGYAEMLEASMFDTSLSAADRGWERFWITPAKVRRLDSAPLQMVAAPAPAIFQVPLHVKTQKMKWVEGELRDDKEGQSSNGALVFSQWFTDNYDIIADETEMTPPEGAGIEGPVKIFHELSRLATITAIAEHLRNTGVPMPAWMRDYELTPVPVDRTTPSLTVTETNRSGTQTATIFGGVNLAPADKDVVAFNAAEPLAQQTVDEADETFVALAKTRLADFASGIPKISAAVQPVASLPSIATRDEDLLNAVVLPGPGSRAFVANRQTVVDLNVPMGRGHSLKLTRYYNSFFDMQDAFGRGWTLGLPRLAFDPVPIARDGYRSDYKSVPRLTRPLGGPDVVFDAQAVVEPYGIELHVARNAPHIAGFGAFENDLLGMVTSQVVFRDGSTWHFSDTGLLLLAEKDGVAIRYVHDGDGRLERLIGYLGDQPTSEIRLEYDSDNRVVSASSSHADFVADDQSSDASRIFYRYNAGGGLGCVTSNAESDECDVTYDYDEALLIQIDQGASRQERFGYNSYGQLVWTETNGSRRTFGHAQSENGATLSVRNGSSAVDASEWGYDQKMRPISHRTGAQETTWTYEANGRVTETSLHDDEIVARQVSTPNGGLVYIPAHGPEIATAPDTAGGVEISVAGVPAARVKRHPNGSMMSVLSGPTEVSPRYDASGLQKGLLVSAPLDDGQTGDWTEERWDLLGRPVEITDASGWSYQISYDQQGRLKSLGEPDGNGGLAGHVIDYDQEGRVISVQSSWGNVFLQYDGEGRVSSLRRNVANAEEGVQLDALGRPTEHTAIDGAVTRWRYLDDGGETVSLPNGVDISSSWSENANALTIGVNAQHRRAEIAISSSAEGAVYSWRETLN